MLYVYVPHCTLSTYRFFFFVAAAERKSELMRLNEVAKSEEVFKIQLHNKFDRFFFFFFY